MDISFNSYYYYFFFFDERDRIVPYRMVAMIHHALVPCDQRSNVLVSIFMRIDIGENGEWVECINKCFCIMKEINASMMMMMD
mmetsp:Transcript_8087/g.10366  ORF Transcript_8087/g.10366 Transcript_8087/m.10366 type:complete len:83 (-) Transcript_8087:13-261(-)